MKGEVVKERGDAGSGLIASPRQILLRDKQRLK